jgi:membrane-associated protease RseP (regulator of RpoE activity)
MNHFLRPNHHLAVAMLLGLGMAVAPPGARAQSSGIAQVIEGPSPLLHSSSQGYLGVLVGDVDNDSAPKLKLKDVRGAIVTLIDHDAPAAQAGIRVNDVVLQLNGQAVEGAEQFGRMLREIPAGRKISLVVSRDGNTQTISVELVDHKKMEHDVWNKLGDSSDEFSPAAGMGILTGGGDVPLSGGFHMPFFGSSLNVGALVEPLTSQMSEYLGVPSGLMVKQVARKSEAEAAGLKAFDVILKVGTEGIATTADWDRALRSNQGKPVQVTILRDRRQQTLTLQVDSKHHHAELEDSFPGIDAMLIAGLDIGEADPEIASQIEQQFVGISPKDAEQLRKEAEKLGDALRAQGFAFDQKQLDEMKRQMDQFRENFNVQDFKLDPKQLEEMEQQMQQFQQQMQEMQLDGCGHFV